MATIEFVVGGARSGKSTYAQQRAELLPGPRVYVATCPVLDDDEMAERIRQHQKARSPERWDTVEAPNNLAEALRKCGAYNVVLVDCITLWVNNVLYVNDNATDEYAVVEQWERVLDAAESLDATVIFVANEVGLGLVPADPVSRLFRDAAGRCNQATAARATKVTFMAAGLPLPIK